MINTVSHIPIYVFFIFFGLLFLGISALKTKEKIFARTIILPLAMFCFSLYWLYSLGFSLYSSIFILGLGFWFFVGKYIWKKKNFLYKKSNDIFEIKGSVLPLILMMIIFFTKFIVGILQARNPEILANIFVFCGFVILYGIFSGIFLNRLYLLSKLRKNY